MLVLRSVAFHDMKDLLSIEGVSLLVMLSNVIVGALLAYLRVQIGKDLATFRNDLRSEFDERYYLAAVQIRDRENYMDFCKRTHERIDRLEEKLEDLQNASTRNRH